MSAAIYRVEVRGNLVVAIRALDPGAHPGLMPEADALAVSTRLAENNRLNACLDGDYHLATFEEARHFAALCLGFLKNLCEKSLEAIAEAGDDAPWENRFVPGPGRPPD